MLFYISLLTMKASIAFGTVNSSGFGGLAGIGRQIVAMNFQY
jgi:hypothetical protein